MVVQLLLDKFCFACIVQWAEYKRLCPLCKRQFTAILHHITSDKEFMTFSLPEWKDDPNKARGQQSISTLRTLPARGIYRPPAARVGPASQARLMATASRCTCCVPMLLLSRRLTRHVITCRVHEAVGETS